MPANIDEVIADLEGLLQRYEAAADHRRVFVRCYCMMMAAMREAMAGSVFRDVRWVEQLECRLAEEFFSALQRYESGGTGLALCWRVAFDCAVQQRTTALADLLLGINAHIVYDYPLGLFRVGVENPGGVNHRYDHDVVDALYESMSARLHNEVARRYDPEMRGAVNLACLLDELLLNEGVRFLRDVAWRDAELMLWLGRYRLAGLSQMQIGRKAAKTARTIARLGKIQT